MSLKGIRWRICQRLGVTEDQLRDMRSSEVLVRLQETMAMRVEDALVMADAFAGGKALIRPMLKMLSAEPDLASPVSVKAAELKEWELEIRHRAVNAARELARKNMEETLLRGGEALWVKKVMANGRLSKERRENMVEGLMALKAQLQRDGKLPPLGVGARREGEAGNGDHEATV